MVTRTLAFLSAAPLLLASILAAQWDATAYAPAGPVHAEGFLVAHANAAGVQVFSAAAQRWETVAPPGATIVGTGDWTVLIKEPSGFRGYSARRNASAPLIVSNPIYTAVADDVALVVDSPVLTISIAYAYSAQTNTWAAQPVAALGNMALSRFVIVLQQDTAYHGFAARTGAWSTLSASPSGGPPYADGNIVLVDLLAPTGGGTPRVAAFSGVRGVWAQSPFYSSPSVALADHNVATVRVAGPTPSQFFQCGYSAYNAQWVTSTAVHNHGDTTTRLSDNVVRIEDVSSTTRFEAFGARPGTGWSQLSGSFLELSIEPDYTLVRSGTGASLEGFSGLCGGMWVPRSVTLPATVLGMPAHLGLVDTPTELHAFLPSANAWAAPLGHGGAAATITVEDALADVLDSSFQGLATRHGGWIAGPAVPAGATFSTTSAGSLIAHHALTGPDAGRIFVFDERCDAWPPPFEPGGPALAVAGRNVLVTHPGFLAAGPIHGYSVQRGDWTAAGPTSLALAPVAEENVAWFADTAGQLWAFGSPNAGHVDYAWPNGTEYHVAGAVAGAVAGTPSVATLTYTMRGKPGELVYAAAALDTLCPGIPIWPVAGLLCLDPATLMQLGAFGVIDSDGLVEAVVPLAASLPACVQVWLQPLYVDGFGGKLRLGARCDPAWLF